MLRVRQYNTSSAVFYCEGDTSSLWEGKISPHKHQISTSSFINLRDMEEGPKINSGAADLPRRPLADKFLYGVLVSLPYHISTS